MQKRTFVLWARVAAFAIVMAWPAGTVAQSPYGLAARQTIPFVITTGDDLGGGWRTEIFLHNPGSLPVTVQPRLFPISQNIGAMPCSPVTVAPFGASQRRLSALCNVPVGISFGRLELSSLLSVQPGEAEHPSGRIFEATARVSGSGSMFTVESFPQGRLSGNRGFADVLGLRNGFDGQHLWHTDCFATALGEPVPVFVRLIDSAGGQLGNFVSAAIDPTIGVEGARFFDIFNLAGAPGNWENIRAVFSTAAQGGIGGAGVFGYCRVVNDSLGHEAFSIAKYLDSNDDAQEFLVSESRTRIGAPFGVVSEIDHSDLGESNLHIAYFEHPDRIECSIRFVNHPPNLAVFDLGQMRLIDPDDNVVAGGNGQMSFSINLRDKSIHNNGRNGRWIVEVGPNHAIKEGGGLKKGGIITTDYVLTCSTGQGVNQLDIAGHCLMPCVKLGGKGDDMRCSFVTPFQANQPWPNGCYY